MELYQIKYFMALVQTLNFTRAAELCNVSQPALTKAIQRLEEEFDGPLIYRERNNTQLTELGRLMLPLLEQTYTAAEAARAQAHQFRRRENTLLRLGTAPEIDTGFLVPVLKTLQQRLKPLELAWRVAGRDTLISLLAEDELDVAILGPHDRLPDSFHRWEILSDAYVVMLPPDHPLARDDTLDAEALKGERLLLRDRPDCEFLAALRRMGLAETIDTRFTHPAASEEQIEQLILSGFGLAMSARSRCRNPALVARPIGGGVEPRAVLLVSPAGRPRAPGADCFIKLVRP